MSQEYEFPNTHETLFFKLVYVMYLISLLCFLGVHKYALKLAVVGDMGLEPCEVRWNICIVQLWNQ